MREILLIVVGGTSLGVVGSNKRDTRDHVGGNERDISLTIVVGRNKRDIRDCSGRR